MQNFLKFIYYIYEFYFKANIVKYIKQVGDKYKLKANNNALKI